MERFLEITQNSDDLAEVINSSIESNAPEEWKSACKVPGGYGETDFLITDNLKIADELKIPIPADAYARWRELEPIPYNSTWIWNQKAISHFKSIDARPEIQAEFKRRGLTPQ